jgi:hypothetical protein
VTLSGGSIILTSVSNECHLLFVSRRHVGGVLVDISYALTSSEDVERFTRMSDDQSRNFSKVLVPGKYIIDFLPWCKDEYFYIKLCLSQIVWPSETHAYVVTRRRVS